MEDKVCGGTMKCQHPDCSNQAYAGICPAHLILIKDENNCINLCANCGSFVAVFIKPTYLDSKYVFCKSCRNCGGTKETEKQVTIDYPFEGRIVKGGKDELPT